MFMATILSNLPKMATFLLFKVFSQKLFEGKKFTREEIIRGYTIFMENEQTKFYRTRLS